MSEFYDEDRAIQRELLEEVKEIGRLLRQLIPAKAEVVLPAVDEAERIRLIRGAWGDWLKKGSSRGED